MLAAAGARESAGALGVALDAVRPRLAPVPPLPVPESDAWRVAPAEPERVASS